MSLLATRRAVGLLISTLGLTNTGELTADSLTVKFPNWTPPRSYSVCANQRLSRDCSFATSQHPFSTRFGIVRFQYIIHDTPVSLCQAVFRLNRSSGAVLRGMLVYDTLVSEMHNHDNSRDSMGEHLCQL